MPEITLKDIFDKSKEKEKILQDTIKNFINGNAELEDILAKNNELKANEQNEELFHHFVIAATGLPVIPENRKKIYKKFYQLMPNGGWVPVEEVLCDNCHCSEWLVGGIVYTVHPKDGCLVLLCANCYEKLKGDKNDKQ